MPYCSANAHCEWLCLARFHDREQFLSIKELPESQFQGLSFSCGLTVGCVIRKKSRIGYLSS